RVFLRYVWSSLGSKDSPVPRCSLTGVRHSTAFARSPRTPESLRGPGCQATQPMAHDADDPRDRANWRAHRPGGGTSADPLLPAAPLTVAQHDLLALPCRRLRQLAEHARLQHLATRQPLPPD